MSSFEERDASELTDEERRWLALDRYLAGDASANDIVLAREWCGDKSASEVIEALRRIRETLSRPVSASDVDSAWVRLRVRLLIEQSVPPTRVPDGTRPPITLLQSDDASQRNPSTPNDSSTNGERNR